MIKSDSFKPMIPWIVLGLMLIVIGVLIALNDWQDSQPIELSSAPNPTQTQVDTPKPIQNPVPTASSQAEAEDKQPTVVLPELNQSDQPLLNGIHSLAPADRVKQYLVAEDVIRKVVVTIDNLDRSGVALDKRAIHPIPGDFFVSEVGDEAGDHFQLDPDNYLRYQNLTQLFAAVDSEKAVLLYFEYYPLFQQAYEELGYPGEYFNDRLVEIIDHLTTWPLPNEKSLVFTRPKSAYVFQNQELESLSVGQKALVSMGPANATRVQNKLRQIKTALTTPND